MLFLYYYIRTRKESACHYAPEYSPSVKLLNFTIQSYLRTMIHIRQNDVDSHCLPSLMVRHPPWAEAWQSHLMRTPILF